jgi:hypothetical protein
MGSNHQPTPYEGAALPLSYGPKERATGFGPAMSAWKADALPLGDAREIYFWIARVSIPSGGLKRQAKKR